MLQPTARSPLTGEGYPNDRAYRSLHGLIDLVAQWSQLAPEIPERYENRALALAEVERTAA